MGRTGDDGSIGSYVRIPELSSIPGSTSREGALPKVVPVLIEMEGSTTPKCQTEFKDIHDNTYIPGQKMTVPEPRPSSESV